VRKIARPSGDQDQRRVAGWHPNRALDEWVRAAACAGPRGAHRPHAWRPLLPYLEPYVTVHPPDRPGRDASGDAPEYRLERECEDVAAVVDTVAPAEGHRKRVSLRWHHRPPRSGRRSTDVPLNVDA
jgi:hypothetical protein